MNKKVLILFALFLLAAAGAGAYIFFQGEAKESVEALDAAVVGALAPTPAFYPLSPFYLQKIEDGKVTRHVIVSLKLEIVDESNVPEVEKKIERIYHRFNSDMHRVVSLTSGQQRNFVSEGLKKRLLAICAEEFGPDVVNGILLEDFWERYYN